MGAAMKGDAGNARRTFIKNDFGVNGRGHVAHIISKLGVDLFDDAIGCFDGTCVGL